MASIRGSRVSWASAKGLKLDNPGFAVALQEVVLGNAQAAYVLIPLLLKSEAGGGQGVGAHSGLVILVFQGGGLLLGQPGRFVLDAGLAGADGEAGDGV